MFLMSLIKPSLSVVFRVVVNNTYKQRLCPDIPNITPFCLFLAQSHKYIMSCVLFRVESLEFFFQSERRP